MQTLKGVIFDFDGTLVRSHDAVFEVLIALTRPGGTPPTPDELRHLSTSETLNRLRVPAWQVPWFAWRARRRLTPLMADVIFEPGVLDVLAALKRRGLKLALVSSNSRRNVRSTLERHDAVALFDVILSGSSLLAKHRTLARALRCLGLQAGQVASVGDETRDIDAATRVGLRAIAVGWGFHAPERLFGHGASAFASTPVDLLDLLGPGPG